MKKYRRKETMQAVQIRDCESIKLICEMLGDYNKIESMDNTEFGVLINDEPASFLDYVILDQKGQVFVFSELSFEHQFERIEKETIGGY